jgi:hypothetical protein
MWIPAGATISTNFTLTSPATNPWGEEHSTPVSFTATNTSIEPNVGSGSVNSYTLLLPSPQTYDFTFKLAGVTDGSADGAKATLKFYLKDGTVKTIPEPIILHASTGDIYKSSVTISNPLPSGTQFRVKVKGEKHVAVTFCKASGQTTPCGDNDHITVPENIQNSYALTFTGIALPGGDLSPQDGQVDLSDLTIIKTIMGKPQSTLTPADLSVADLNYDGRVNIYDVFLILKTMEVRYDQ